MRLGSASGNIRPPPPIKSIQRTAVTTAEERQKRSAKVKNQDIK